MTAGAGAEAPARQSGESIDCYRLDLAVCDEADLALLDDTERSRAARFHFDRDRIRYVAAHAQARRHLGARLGVAPADVALTTTRYGKPVLAPAGPGERFCFNLSHSGTVGYLAIASVSVGIDVELHRPIEDLQSLIDTYCTRSEAAALSALPDSERLAGFLGVWTRKEAVLKAWGTGIGAIPLDVLHVGTSAETVDARQILLPDTEGGPVDYPDLRVWSLADRGQVLSLAAATPRPLQVRMMDPHMPPAATPAAPSAAPSKAAFPPAAVVSTHTSRSKT